MQSTFKGACLATATTCQFSKSSGCLLFVPKIHNCMQKFGRKFLSLKKTCLKINVQDSSFKFWPNFFSKMGHFSATIKDLVYGLVS